VSSPRAKPGVEWRAMKVLYLAIVLVFLGAIWYGGYDYAVNRSARQRRFSFVSPSTALDTKTGQICSTLPKPIDPSSAGGVSVAPPHGLPPGTVVAQTADGKKIDLSAGIISEPTPDYDALAKKFGAISSTPALPSCLDLFRDKAAR
jgi:hypothetical protein